MKNLLYKEFRLTGALITYLFIAFTLMTFIPNYPTLVATFFICMGIFYSFQFAREFNDTIYTALLPVKKADVVKARYLFVCAIQLVSFVLFALFVLFRLTFLATSPAYSNTSLMIPNIAFLGYALMSFSIFNSVFISGFYKTAYSYGKPFLAYVVVQFVFFAITEALHFIPVLNFLNETTTSALLLQSIILCLGIIIYISITYLGYKKSVKRFEKIDL